MKRTLITLATVAALIAVVALLTARPTDCDHLLQAQADAMDPTAIDADEAAIRCFQKEARK